MADPTNQNAGATPPEDAAVEPTPETPAAGEAAEEATAAIPASDEVAAQRPASDAAEARTAAMAAAPAGAGTPPRQAWYRRRWAVITGAVAAAVILFLAGTAVGTTIGDGRDGRGEFRDGRGMLPGGDKGFGHEDWGDNGMGQGVVPPDMGQDSQGFGHGGEDWDQDGDSHGQPLAPGTTPAPSTSPQALTQ